MVQAGGEGRRIAMDGVTGSLEAEGDLTALMPYFRAGEALPCGIGNQYGDGAV